MNKLKLTLFALAIFGMVGIARAEQGAPMFKPMNFVGVAGASIAIVSSGSGVLYGIDLSSGPSTDYLIAIDSQIGQSISLASFADAARITPALQFSTSTSLSAVTNPVAYVRGSGIDYGPKGVYFKNGLFIFKTSANSGEATRATVRFSR